MEISDFKVGDRLMLSFHHKKGTQVFSAEVSVVDYNGNGLITYRGIGSNPSGQGTFNPTSYNQNGRVIQEKAVFGLIHIIKRNN